MLTVFLLAAAVSADPAVTDAGSVAVQSDGVPIPAAIKSMLDAALASGNEGEVSTIVKYARLSDPASADAVLAIAQKWQADRAAVRDRRLRQADMFDLWTGRAELGGFFTTGNSDTAGASGVLDLTREGLRWRHKFRAQADYQESLNVTTREHYLASYEPNFKVSDRAYVYGAAQYESDRFLGYDNRLVASTGLGYRAVQRPSLTMDVELGPAFRHTSFTDDSVQSTMAARGTVQVKWQLLPGLSFNQSTAGYLERYNSTVSSNTSLSARLIGPLQAQLSYNVQYESESPSRTKPVDTIGRASLVYTF